ncbi:polysaccharide lyase 8 family protein [Plantactinospora mayteni]|uniref:Lyase n=1 Tax=Plantactinospora mayteni TaxID=566021 RepID=A0ABQ4EH92_9ACTN|nr:polysaccharide lyase 8 family protein [Plantactinospora mayteni]GIG93616.1 lyase [Plantactinospora mayteni]
MNDRRTPGYSRRALLGAGAAVAAGTVAPTVLATGGSAAPRPSAADDFALMRQQWRALHVTSGYDPADPAVARVLTRITDDGQRWWSSMAKGSGRTYLWSDARPAVHRSFAIRDSFVRLRAMALAWATPGAGLAGDATLLADTIGGLDWIVANWYDAPRPPDDNWYEWEISGPRAFNDAQVILYDRLAASKLSAYGRATARHTPRPVYTAANRALTAHVVVGRGALLSDAATVASGVAGLGDVLGYVTSGDGFYRDGSFIQHDYYPYAGSYGASILDALAPALATVAGTARQIDGSMAVNWIRDAFDPLIWRGAFMDMAMGRVISRPDEQNHAMGGYTLTAALGLIPAVPAGDQPWLRSVLKEWLLADASGDPLPDRNIPVRLTAAALMNDDTVARRGPLAVSKVYPRQDRIVHRKPTWALGISMFSSRIANYESINDENLRGWLTADGATYLYVGDGGEFGNGYWPTVDPTRIPGTTAEVRSRSAAEGRGYRSTVNWAGGATAEGRYTAGGINLAAQGSTLTAKKSWFCFDEEVVALGAAITASGGGRINTYVENRQLGGAEKLLVNGAEVVAAPGWTEVPGTRWLHLTGVGGYVFPTPTQVDFRREARTGRWTDINKHPVYAGQTGAITRTYLSAWIEHGTSPSNASYAYVLLPTATPERTAEYAASPNTRVVANTPTVQAARALSSGVLAINFWAAGTASIVTSQNAGSVVLVERPTELVLAVADPTHRASQIRLTVNTAATSVLTPDPNVQVVTLDPLTVLVNVSGAAGATRTIRLTR